MTPTLFAPAPPPAAGDGVAFLHRRAPAPTVPAARAGPVEPLYAGLAASLQRLIEQDTLRPGHRVPSVRRMSLQRGVSISTVLQAYTLLENRGYLEARPQSGYYVRPRPLLSVPEPRMARPMARPAYVSTGDLLARMRELALDPNYVPFATACPHHSLFPAKKLARLLGSVSRNDPTLVGRYAMNWTYEPLAREIARRYLLAGAPLHHNELVITVGCTEAINLCLRAVTRPGDIVAIETPAYFGFLDIIESLNLKALEIPTDSREGICLDALRTALEQNEIKVVLVMPSFQNPLGSCMPDAKKERLYRLLADYGVPAIEDDIYGDLQFCDRRPKPLKAWDADGLVMLVSSFGKTLAPGFRIGWAAPGRQFEHVRHLKFTNTIGTPAVLQKVLADFLRDGGYDHHLRSIRRAYQNQMHLFSQAIARHFPEGTRFSRPQGSMILWVEFPAGVDTIRLHADALKHRINTAPGPLFSVKDRYRNCLRMNCGIPWSAEIDDALRMVGDLAQRQL
ncbi:MAG TPA: PLP-dependent aminotransferase family protein [Opitutaceae bacterium]|nr:PLP-dependent aminotransferase family protein [Opitutaceae bacterium]